VAEAPKTETEIGIVTAGRRTDRKDTGSLHANRNENDPKQPPPCHAVTRLNGRWFRGVEEQDADKMKKEI